MLNTFFLSQALVWDFQFYNEHLSDYKRMIVDKKDLCIKLIMITT